MKADELKTMIVEALKEQIDDLKLPAQRKAFIDEAGGPTAADGYLKQAQYYASVIGVKTVDGQEIKAITDDIMYSGSNAQGGYIMAPAETMAEIVRIGKDASAVLRLARTFPQKPETVNVPSDTSDLTFTFVGEAVKKTTTKLTLSSTALTLKKAAGIVVLSDEMVSGSIVNIVDYLNMRLGEDWGETVDTMVLGPALATPWDNIANVSGTIPVVLPEAGVDYDSAVDITTALPAKATKRARIFMHRTVLGEFRKVKGTDGHPIFQPPYAGAPGTILGFPVELIDVMPTWSGASAGEMVALFGDLGYWYAGQGDAFNIGVSRDAAVTLDGALTSLWENNLIGVRAEARMSGALVLPSAFCKISKAS